LTGFINGEGCFLICIQDSKTYKIGKKVMLKFTINQNIRDEQLLESFIKHFNCGYLNYDLKNNAF